MCKTIKRKVKFRAEPADVYRHLVQATDKVGKRFTMGAGSGIVYFGVSPEIWLDLQSDYELRVARQTIWPHVALSVKIRG